MALPVIPSDEYRLLKAEYPSGDQAALRLVERGIEEDPRPDAAVRRRQFADGSIIDYSFPGFAIKYWIRPDHVWLQWVLQGIDMPDEQTDFSIE